MPSVSRSCAIYLGPITSITMSQLLAALCTAAEYTKMRLRRMALLAGGPTGPAVVEFHKECARHVRAQQKRAQGCAEARAFSYLFSLPRGSRYWGAHAAMPATPSCARCPVGSAARHGTLRGAALTTRTIPSKLSGVSLKTVITISPRLFRASLQVTTLVTSSPSYRSPTCSTL
jgi:hypothetical protein